MEIIVTGDCVRCDGRGYLVSEKVNRAFRLRGAQSLSCPWCNGSGSGSIAVKPHTLRTLVAELAPEPEKDGQP